MENFSQRLKQALQNKAWSLRDFSRISGIPISTVSRIYNGVVTPRYTTVERCARVLDVSVDWLIGNIEDSPFINFKDLQKEVLRNKLEKFGTPLMEREFCYAQGELSEAFDSYLKADGHIGEELADVVIYLMGIAELSGVDLGKEILTKIAINKTRTYHLEGNKMVKDDK